MLANRTLSYSRCCSPLVRAAETAAEKASMGMHRPLHRRGTCCYTTIQQVSMLRRAAVLSDRHRRARSRCARSLRAHVLSSVDVSQHVQYAGTTVKNCFRHLIEITCQHSSKTALGVVPRCYTEKAAEVRHCQARQTRLHRGPSPSPTADPVQLTSDEVVLPLRTPVWVDCSQGALFLMFLTRPVTACHGVWVQVHGGWVPFDRVHVGDSMQTCVICLLSCLLCPCRAGASSLWVCDGLIWYRLHRVVSCSCLLPVCLTAVCPSRCPSKSRLLTKADRIF